MYCSRHLRVLLLTAAMLLPGPVLVLAQGVQSQNNSQTAGTEVHLHWGARPGVSRYRLQLASDNAFADIVFDRVVAGNDYQVNDLTPGKYFWRIAPLTNTLGEFSAAGIIQVRLATAPERPGPTQKTTPSDNSSRTMVAVSPIVARGGWRAAVGDIAHPVLGHLRSPEKFDLVGINSDGVVFALDSASGIALWSTGRKPQTGNSTRAVPGALVLLRQRSGLDNVVVLSGAMVTASEGATGRELWRATLPATTSSGTVVSNNRSSEIFLIDNSLQRAMILDANDGHLLTQTRLPHRVVGAPVPLVGRGNGQVALAYDFKTLDIFRAVFLLFPFVIARVAAAFDLGFPHPGGLRLKGVLIKMEREVVERLPSQVVVGEHLGRVDGVLGSVILGIDLVVDDALRHRRCRIDGQRRVGD